MRDYRDRRRFKRLVEENPPTPLASVIIIIVTEKYTSEDGVYRDSFSYVGQPRNPSISKDAEHYRGRFVVHPLDCDISIEFPF